MGRPRARAGARERARAAARAGAGAGGGASSSFFGAGGSFGSAGFGAMLTRPLTWALEALLRDGPAQDVVQERLTSSEAERAGARGGVEREAVERGAERLVVGEGVRREPYEAARPLRAGRRGLTRDGRGGEGDLFVGLVVVVALEQAAAAKVRVDTLHDALEQVADFACLQMTERS